MKIEDFIKTIEKDKVIVVLEKNEKYLLCRPKTGLQYNRIVKLPLKVDEDNQRILSSRWDACSRLILVD